MVKSTCCVKQTQHEYPIQQSYGKMGIGGSLAAHGVRHSQRRQTGQGENGWALQAALRLLHAHKRCVYTHDNRKQKTSVSLKGLLNSSSNSNRTCCHDS